MDPGNWATDLAGGSRFGYGLLWVLVMSNLIALLLQSLSARLGRGGPPRPGAGFAGAVPSRQPIFSCT